MKQAGMNERIHKGFRVWLFETGIRVQQTDFTNTDEGRKMASELQELLKTLDRKYLLETQFFFPALALEAPFSVSLLEEEKREAESHSRMLGRLVRQYFQPGTPGHYFKTGMAIQEAFCKMVSFLMVYMNHQDVLFREIAGHAKNLHFTVDELSEVLVHEGGSKDAISLMLLKAMGVNEIKQWLETDTMESNERKWALIDGLDPVFRQALQDMRQDKVKHLRVAA
jgi:hypothetical protein